VNPKIRLKIMKRLTSNKFSNDLQNAIIQRYLENALEK